MTDTSAVTPDAGTPVEGTPVSDDNAAASSTAETGAKSMLEAVETALKPDEDNEPSPGSQTPEKQSADGVVAAEKDGENRKEGEIQPLSDEERRSVSAKTARRFDQLLARNRTLQGDAEKLSTELSAVKAKAESYDQFNGFLARNRLTSEDVDKGFEVMAALKNDPAKAWSLIQPIVTQLKGLVGEGDLPADLAEKVRLGYVDEPTARELARQRATNTQNERRFADDQQRREEDARRQQIDTMVTTARDTANEWEDAKRKADPDWHLKQERVHEKIKLALLEDGGQNYPKTKADVVKMLDSIHDSVTKELKKFLPKPSKVDPPARGSASSKSVSEPKTMLEAVQAGISAR